MELDGRLNLRISEADRLAFNNRCNDYGVAPQDMLREMIAAFNAGTLRIHVPENQLKILKGIHHVD